MPDNNALHIAAKEGDLVQVQSHVGNFDINAKGDKEETALLKAAEKGHADIVKLFLTLNADVNIPNVNTFKMKYVNLICIFLLSHYPYFIPYFLHLSIVTTLTLSLFLLQLMIVNNTDSMFNNTK